MDRMSEQIVSNITLPNNENRMAENTLRILSKRRSCRNFTGEQLTHREIETLIQAGRTAPIGMNSINFIQILVIQNQNLLEELELNALNYYSEQNFKLKSAIYQAPTLIIVAVKKLSGSYEKGQYCSAACILENMIFAATEMNIGNVYLSGVTTALNQNQELLIRLGVPDDYEAASAIAVGKTIQEIPERDLFDERIATKWLT